jgi:hypothetical protein
MVLSFGVMVLCYLGTIGESPAIRLSYASDPAPFEAQDLP